MHTHIHVNNIILVFLVLTIVGLLGWLIYILDKYINITKLKLKEFECKAEITKLVINRFDKIEEYAIKGKIDGLEIDISKFDNDNLTFSIKNAKK